MPGRRIVHRLRPRPGRRPRGRITRYFRPEDDPEALDVDFRFRRFPEVRPDVFASDHCPVVFEVP